MHQNVPTTAPAADPPALVDTLAATVASLRELAGSLTVKDHLSHVGGLEVDVDLDLDGRPDGRPDAEVALPDLPHLTDGNRVMEISVGVRRETPAAAVLSELAEISATRIDGLRRQLAAPDFDPMAKARGPSGRQLPLRTLVGLRQVPPAGSTTRPSR